MDFDRSVQANSGQSQAVPREGRSASVAITDGERQADAPGDDDEGNSALLTTLGPRSERGDDDDEDDDAEPLTLDGAAEVFDRAWMLSPLHAEG